MNARHQKIDMTSTEVTINKQNQRVFLVETYVEESKRKLHDKLIEQGVNLVATATIAHELAKAVIEHSPDILVLSVDFLDAATLDQLIQVNRDSPLPVVVFAKQHAPEAMKVVVEAEVSSYVVDNVDAHRLPVILDLAAARFTKMQSVSDELKQTKERLSERKLIEKAKGILMQQKSLTEEQAYSQMRRSAMNQGQSMAELAKRIIGVFEMLD